MTHPAYSLGCTEVERGGGSGGAADVGRWLGGICGALVAQGRTRVWGRVVGAGARCPPLSPCVAFLSGMCCIARSCGIALLGCAGVRIFSRCASPSAESAVGGADVCESARM